MQTVEYLVGRAVTVRLNLSGRDEELLDIIAPPMGAVMMRKGLMGVKVTPLAHLQSFHSRL